MIIYPPSPQPQLTNCKAVPNKAHTHPGRRRAWSWAFSLFDWYCGRPVCGGWLRLDRRWRCWRLFSCWLRRSRNRSGRGNSSYRLRAWWGCPRQRGKTKNTVLRTDTRRRPETCFSTSHAHNPLPLYWWWTTPGTAVSAPWSLFCISIKYFSGVGDGLSDYEHWLFPERTRVSFPALTQLTVNCNYLSRGSDTRFRPPDTAHWQHTNIYRQNPIYIKQQREKGCFISD